jgi:hypothetical protein
MMAVAGAMLCLRNVDVTAMRFRRRVGGRLHRAEFCDSPWGKHSVERHSHDHDLEQSITTMRNSITYIRRNSKLLTGDKKTLAT